jgi:plastocyanin
MKLALGVAAVVALLAVPTVFAAGDTVKVGTLKGTVGPGFTITLTQNGKKVTTLKAGKYKVVVSDKSNIHNFHLTGPGVNNATSVGGTGSKTWTLSLKKGTYKYVCDPHKTSMKGSFKVT